MVAVKYAKHDVHIENVFLIIVSVLMVVFIFLMGWREVKYRNVLASINFPVYDEILSPKVDESFQRDYVGVLKSMNESVYGGVPRNTFSDQVGSYCTSWIHGYDEQYIYAYVVCGEYAWSYNYSPAYGEDNTIEVSRSLHKWSGWSSHIRLSYEPGTDFEIVGYKQPLGGVAYHKDVERLFSNIGSLGYPGEPTQKTTHEELKARFYQEHGNDPFPEQINEIYEIKNPKVIIVGEVK